MDYIVRRSALSVSHDPQNLYYSEEEISEASMTLINNYDSTPIADSADIHLRSRLGIETPLDSDIGASYEGNQSFQAGTEQHQLAFHNS